MEVWPFDSSNYGDGYELCAGEDTSVPLLKSSFFELVSNNFAKSLPKDTGLTSNIDCNLSCDAVTYNSWPFTSESAEYD